VNTFRGGRAVAKIVSQLRPRRVAALLAPLLLAGCIDSGAPLLTGAQPLFGPTVRIHGYSLTEGRASGPDVANFRWDGVQYRAVGRPTFDVASFTAVPLSGNDLVIQSRSSRPQVKGIEYALAHKLADGVYLVAAIDEADADDATRAKFCARGVPAACRVETSEAALAFARATAARPDPKGSLAVIVGGRGR
jgi:hypothetical protein